MSNASVERHWSLPGMEWPLTVIGLADEARPAAAELSSCTDQELVARTLGGETAAFDVLVERHRRTVYQICFRFARGHEDASDLAQEVFVRAWRGLPRFRGRAAFSTWLYRIAINACLSKVAAKGPVTAPLADVDDIEDVRADRPGTSLLRAERAEAVRRAIRRLPGKQRATLVLRTYHELTHQQIAVILGSSVGAVKANFFHALANLRRILGREP